MNFFNIPGELYSTIYLLLIVLFSLLVCIHLSFQSANGNNVLYAKGKTTIVAIVFFVVITLFLGLRPLGEWFGDTNYYLYTYNNVLNSYSSIDWSQEWVWDNFSYLCKMLGFDNSSYLFVINILYVGCMLITCFKLTKNNVGIAFTFCISAMSFYAYAVNGLRNGLACSISMLAIALLCGSKLEKCISLLLMILAYGIHHSVVLPCLCAIIAYFFIKEPKYSILFWLLSIIISLVFGNVIGDFFGTLGFDERTSYFEDVAEKDSAELFSSTGFRFDFLLYSAIPVAFIWYLTIKRNFNDVSYNLIANTYVLANAFWIMVIRAAYSNRFAYLSWFLYPIVLAYPLLRMNITKKQNFLISVVIILHTLFTVAILILR